MRLTFQRIGWGVVGTLFLIAPLFASSSKEESKAVNAPAEYNWAYAEEASRLLTEVRSLSVKLAEDSDLLKHSSRRGELEWTTHGLYLDEIRGHVNAMGKNLQRLREIHSMIAPWQQKAVDRIMPNAVELAAHTKAAIAHQSKQFGPVSAPVYNSSISALADHAVEIRDSVGAFLDYAETSERLGVLERQIEYEGA